MGKEKLWKEIDRLKHHEESVPLDEGQCKEVGEMRDLIEKIKWCQRVRDRWLK